MVSGGNKTDLNKPCEYTVQREGRTQAIILECRDCDNPGHDLNVTRCYRGALNAYRSEVNIDIITTAHYLETQYKGPSVELFGNMSGLQQDLMELSKRDPVADGKKTDPKGKYKKHCPDCRANPGNVFPKLEAVLKKNPKEFITVFKKTVSELPVTDLGKQCPACRKTAVEELEVAFSSYKKMVEQILRDGYKKRI